MTAGKDWHGDWVLFVPEQMVHERGESRRPRCSHAYGGDLSCQNPKKLLAFSALYNVEGFPSNSTNSGAKYLTIMLTFFTPKGIFSCGLLVAWTLGFLINLLYHLLTLHLSIILLPE